ncbi:MAG: arylsulfatase, partial [Anaerolineales bacterium]|nr:arylsulfatase [Anaerolineales bacterium]
MHKTSLRKKAVRWAAVGCILAGVSIAATAIPKDAAAATQKGDKPNIVLINMDNLGYGELGVYGGGILRGGATPRIDKLATEGIRLLNYNVEAQCTPSRAALMTGRYAIRTGNGSVPLSTPDYGLTQWEYTLPEMLGDVGYATAMFGKWHLGQAEGRYPTNQGFDEWYGIPNSTDESLWPSQQMFNELKELAEKTGKNPMIKYEHVYSAKKGSPAKVVKVYDLPARREIDREITDLAKGYMSRQAKAGKPFFLYLPYTQVHQPNLPSKEFTGKSGNGNWGDVLMQIDAYTGELLDKVDELGIADNTIFIFTSDNGGEMVPGYNGWGGPWSGSYFTGKEGSLRTPFIMRWPGKVPAGKVSNEIVHQFDLYATLAKFTGGKVPTDRVIDSKDMTNFFLGKQEESGREGIVIYVGNDIHGVKWRNYKLMFKEFEGGLGTGKLNVYPLPRFYNLYNDPKEEYP